MRQRDGTRTKCQENNLKAASKDRGNRKGRWRHKGNSSGVCSLNEKEFQNISILVKRCAICNWEKNFTVFARNEAITKRSLNELYVKILFDKLFHKSYPTRLEVHLSASSAGLRNASPVFSSPSEPERCKSISQQLPCGAGLALSFFFFSSYSKINVIHCDNKRNARRNFKNERIPNFKHTKICEMSHFKFQISNFKFM